MDKQRLKRRNLATTIEPTSRLAGSAWPVQPQLVSSASPDSLARATVAGWGLWISIGLIAANVAEYSAVRYYDFVNYDDP